MPKVSSWTRYDIENLLALRRQNIKWVDIASILRRSKTACQAKFTYLETGREGKKHKRVTASIAPNIQEIDRNNRLAAGPRDLTGAFFGDPPIGYSALERRV